MGTKKPIPTATASLTIAELKERADHALGAIAYRALSMVQCGWLDVATCRSELTRRSIVYLRAQSAYAGAIGLPVMAANYRDEADALEGRAK